VEFPAAKSVTATPGASSEKLSFREKAGYALGDSGTNFVFQMIVMFQLPFYTDTFGISAASAAKLLGFARLWDAVCDPVVGALADHTATRWGKFRPWILWTAVPFGVLGVLTFWTPNLGAHGKLVYAYASCMGLMMVYSANNVPYSALSGVMTHDLSERTSLSSYRFVFAICAQLVVMSLALPMVHWFGDGSSTTGFRNTMAVFSVAAVVFFLITFASTKERVVANQEQQHSVREHFARLIKTGPWRAMFLVTVVLFVGLAMRNSMVLFYFRYYLRREDLFSIFNLVGGLSSVGGVLLSKPLAMRYGKKKVFAAAILVTSILTATFSVLSRGGLTLIFGIEVIRQFVYGVTIPLLWAAMGDVADFCEWKYARRATGMVFSGIVLGLKTGLGCGGALGSLVLSWYGYVANAAQSERALMGIRLAMGIFPAAAFTLCAACLLSYSIDRSVEVEMAQSLAARRDQPAVI
jgi:glycoside/pentoside/hexuronide:cation symporter, GPH family